MGSKVKLVLLLILLDGIDLDKDRGFICIDGWDNWMFMSGGDMMFSWWCPEEYLDGRRFEKRFNVFDKPSGDERTGIKMTK